MEKPSARSVALGIVALCVSAAVALNAVDSSHTRQLVAEQEQAAQVAAVPDLSPFVDYQQLSDPLLVLVNGRVALPQDWEMLPFFVDGQAVNRRMGEDLSRMLEDAAEENVWLWVASGYRSSQRQKVLFQQQVERWQETGCSLEEAREKALQTVALPGHSEHQTGLAVDFSPVSPAFAQTEAYGWLQEHGAAYGFVQRYPAGKESWTGVAEESWHYRYVGRRHASNMQRLGLCLEEYVLSEEAGKTG